MRLSSIAGLLTAVLLTVVSCRLAGAAEPLTLNVWPGQPPNEAKELPAESDLTKPEDRLIAGRRIIKLGNVSTPQIAVFRPAAAKDTGAAVVICPGGGHHILAYDLEGTEVAEWLNEIGVTAIVLKYRVPFRDPDKRWLSGVQDAQRAMSLVRSKAGEWKIDPQRIGLLGFSAGGQVAGLVSTLQEQRQYEPRDDVDQVSSRPDFSILIYPAGFEERNQLKLKDEIKITKSVPPTFFVHAFDDNVSVLNTLIFAAEMKKVGVPAEIHVYASGGHGYGLRHVDGQPVTDWPKPCEAWLRASGIIK